jgi:hypothetical protein
MLAAKGGRRRLSFALRTEEGTDSASPISSPRSVIRLAAAVSGRGARVATEHRSGVAR